MGKKGYSTDTAARGEEGIKKFLSNSYDVVITDIKMPGMSGHKVLSEIKKLNSTPVIGISGTPWLFENHSFDAVLEKPYMLEDLLETIRKITYSTS